MAGELFDHAIISVTSGKGGDGSAIFRREKFMPRGGPSGGDGGRGGHVYLRADPGINTLLSFQHQRKFAAEPGGNGQKNNMHGRQGADVEIMVPVGTVVKVRIDDEVYSVDLDRAGQRLLAARGGKGGLGNVHFTSSTHQAPHIAELGEPGQSFSLELELKLIADVGLVGFPNAGKSTLLSVISAARPKIAAYPFTTLQPNLGIVEVGSQRFIVADIPGLIEGAHQGIGLGHGFLRHVERNRLLIHVIDTAGVDGRDPLDDYHQIMTELKLYQPELLSLPMVVALNKQDLPDAQDNLERLLAELPVAKVDLFPIAAVTREGVAPLLTRVAAILRDMPALKRTPDEGDEEPLVWPLPPVDENRYSVEREADGWRVRGVRIERLLAMTNFAQDEALDRVQRVLEATGISDELVRQGVDEGDVVRIGRAELIWSDTDLMI
jgi:GTP-binding protein